MRNSEPSTAIMAAGIHPSPELARSSDRTSIRIRHLIRRADTSSASLRLNGNSIFPTADTNVDIATGLVSTFAGSGTSATVDGTGSGASFKDMGGSVVVSGAAYVSTTGAVRRVDLATAQVTTRAGSPTSTGCVDSTDPTAVRFGGSGLYLGDMDSDGTYLYLSDPECGIRKIDLASGATSTLTTTATGSVTVGPDGFLYVAGSSYIYRVDTTTGSKTNYYQYTFSKYGISIAADSSYLWVIEGLPCGTDLLRITLANGSTTLYSLSGSCPKLAGISQLASAGNYLYVSNLTDSALERITKATARSCRRRAPRGRLPELNGDRRMVLQDHRGRLGRFQSLVVGFRQPSVPQCRADTALPKSESGLPNRRSTSTRRVTTFAGDGTAATVDARGTAASFKNLGGATIVDGAAYLSTIGAVRRIDLATAQVTTLTGSPTATGCVDSADPAQVRLGGTGLILSDMDSDGYYLYLSDPECGIRRVSLSTGATSTVTSAVTGSLTYGPDGYLYVASNGPWVYRVDPINGTVTNYYQYTTYKSGLSITSDATHLWITEAITPSFPCGNDLLRIKLSDGSTTIYSIPGFCTAVAGIGQLVSAGDFLYVSAPGDTGVERITKATGAVGNLVGSSAGMSDDSWHGAKFSQVTGLASDGTDLWIADSGNHRLRRVKFVPLLAQEIGPAQVVDASTPRALRGDPVDTSSGNFSWSTTDASVPGIGMPFVFTRWYNSLLPHVGRFGVGWTDSFDASLEILGNGDVRAFLPNGPELTFTKSGASYTSGDGVRDTLVKNISNEYLLTQPDHTVYRFNAVGALLAITDRNGHALTLSYSSGQLDSVTDTANRTIDFSYPNADTTVMTLPGGRTVTYRFVNGQLRFVDDLGGGTTTYTYNGAQLAQITDQNNQPVVANLYDLATGAVISQLDANQYTSYYSTLFPGSDSGVTTFTDNNGHDWIDSYDGGKLISSTDPNNNVTTYSNYDIHNNPTQITRPGNRLWVYNYTYDDPGDGHVTSLTIIPPLTSNTTSYTYNSFSEVTSFTDGRGNVTRYEYDAAGNLTCVLLPTAPGATCSGATQANKQLYTYNPTSKLLETVTDPRATSPRIATTDRATSAGSSWGRPRTHATPRPPVLPATRTT